MESHNFHGSHIATADGIPLSMVEFIKVQLTVATRTAYIPVPLMGVKVREIEIA